MQNVCVVLFFTLCFSMAKAQVGMSPLNPVHAPLLLKHLSTQKTIQQTAFHPFIRPMDELDSVYDADAGHWQRKEWDTWILRKMRNEHLLEVREDDFRLFVDPTLNFEVARQRDEDGRRMYTNSRGYQLVGSVGKRVFFASSFYETQSIFPAYLDSVVSERGDFNDPADPERGSVPGYGRWKPFNTSDSYDYDYTLGTGYVGVAIKGQSFVQFGHDKQFVGYGYRSLLLSDASAPYPMLRLHGAFLKNKLTYTTTWAVLQYLERVAPVNYNGKEAMFRRLGGRFSYLHYQPLNWLGMGAFDGSTWNWFDNSRANLEYYSPHAFAHVRNGATMNRINQIYGLNAHLDLGNAFRFYGQWALNALNQGARGTQLGVMLLDVVEGLNFRFEYNNILGGLQESGDGADVGHASREPFLNNGASVFYQHNDQLLGHPLGVEVREFVLKFDHRWRDIFVSGTYVNALKFHSGHNSTRIEFIQFETGYIINPKSNAQLVFGNINRIETGSARSSLDTYTYLALRTSLLNRYIDF